MLSILIPIYEVKVEKLVNKLIKQCLAAKIEFEILCFDDCSSDDIKKANRAIDLSFGVNYVELSENKGRAKIRNLLAKMSRYDYLLFLDCDSEIKNKNFIKTYIKYLNPNGVLCGGRIYSPSKPKDISKVLHWTYGIKRESRKSNYRNKHKVNYFHSNNFVIHRHTMFENPFEENIQGYGYEDLALANQLDQRGVVIIHIDNPILHAKLEKDNDFIDKSLEATTNLWKLFKEGKVLHTRMIKAYKFIDTYYLKDRFLGFYNKRKDKILLNLKSNKPSMLYFDLFRLAHFVEISILSEVNEKLDS